MLAAASEACGRLQQQLWRHAHLACAALIPIKHAAVRENATGARVEVNDQTYVLIRLLRRCSLLRVVTGRLIPLCKACTVDSQTGNS